MTPYSWRVELLPLLSEVRGLSNVTTREQYNTAIKACGYDTSEVWDSDVNAAVLKRMPDVFRHPGDPADTTNTAFYAIMGAGTAFDADHVSQYTDYMDPAGWIGETLMIAESRKNQPWTKPVDIAYSAEGPVPALGGYADGGALILTGDGAVHFLDDTVGEADRRALITKSQDDTFSIIGIPFEFDR